MRINSIAYANNHNSVSLNYNTRKINNSRDIVNFKANDNKYKKTSLLEKIKLALNGKNSSSVSEQKKSDSIQHFIQKLEKDADFTRKIGDYYYRDLIFYLKKGQEKDFTSKVALNNSSYVTFSEVNEKTNLPDVITLWHDNKLEKVFEIEDTEDMFRYSVTDYKSFPSISKIDMIDDNVLFYSERNESTKVERRMVPAKKAICFYEGVTNYFGGEMDILKEYTQYPGSNQKNTYIDCENGEICVYTYEDDTQSWVKNKIDIND